ncbi:uncharacterized protein LOC131247286 [Magnolia sinica]|uniref:uncharacterized protein LOC131247286 n=1 Tax=Magnolia sinica TaxID=86752 RepID=UPI00265B2818|nr:uncharacterized protein LOC131247286 [Magnolia sinica]
MASMSSSFLFFLLSLSFLSMTQAQVTGNPQPRIHGLAQEKPAEFSPSAFNFFHPKFPTPTHHTFCATARCSASPVSSVSSTFDKPEATQVHKSVWLGPHENGPGIGAGGIAGIVFGSVLFVVLAMGAYYAVITHRANADRANSMVQPDV